MKSSHLIAAIAAALALGTSSFAVANPAFKQLAGPPDEFAAMQPLAVGAAAIHSKSALIPIQLGVDKAGGLSWSGTLPVENGRSRFLLFSGSDVSLQAELRSPDGRIATAAKSLASAAKRSEFGIESSSFPADYYAFEQIDNGAWTLKVRANGNAPSRAFLLIEGDQTTQLASYQAHHKQLLGERLQIAALLTRTEAEGAPLSGKAAGNVQRAVLRVTAPDGVVSEYQMRDDGKQGDGLANDGTFGGEFKALQTGNYVAQVEVEAIGRGGEKLLRTAEHVVPVLEPVLQIASNQAVSKSNAPGRQAVTIPVQSSKSSGHYRAYAEVWGTSKSGKAVPVAWISGMTELTQGGLPLGLDERWVAKAGARAPFELRNVRVEDPDHFVTLTSSKRMGLTLPAIKSKAEPNLQPDEMMTMGPRPVAASQKGVGTRLLLVHGYCSGGVWPSSNFSNASTFLDANQNRSHDQFAQLIRNFGNTWNSFGVVAHSQGGAAALHLYTYYWSGLDNATGSRLIQSVGTPYQGTNIAGILASLGSWFGVGCGSNSNLTYSGASSWLAGIPTARRAKVNYYTTSFDTAWWRYDYCHLGTDLALSDPEDGTVEQAKGQLSGAVNRGHTKGQCHTAGMRDPAQYQDSSRNATMNSNAAR